MSNPRHGRWFYATRIRTTDQPAWLLRRAAGTRKADALAALDLISDLVGLAEGDDGVAALIGDMIREKTKHGGQLPTVDDVRRRLGAGERLERSRTVGEWLEEWLASKRDIRRSTLRSYTSHIRLYLTPRLGPIPLDRLRPANILDMVDWIERTNTTRDRPVGKASLQRIRATLRSALSDAQDLGLVTDNTAKRVKLPSGKRPKAVVWTPERVTAFWAQCERIAAAVPAHRAPRTPPR